MEGTEVWTTVLPSQEAKRSLVFRYYLQRLWDAGAAGQDSTCRRAPRTLSRSPLILDIFDS